MGHGCRRVFGHRGHNITLAVIGVWREYWTMAASFYTLPMGAVGSESSKNQARDLIQRLARDHGILISGVAQTLVCVLLQESGTQAKACATKSRERFPESREDALEKVPL
jgi:hypothetical protein